MRSNAPQRPRRGGRPRGSARPRRAAPAASSGAASATFVAAASASSGWPSSRYMSTRLITAVEAPGRALGRLLEEATRRPARCRSHRRRGRAPVSAASSCGSSSSTLRKASAASSVAPFGRERVAQVAPRLGLVGPQLGDAAQLLDRVVGAQLDPGAPGDPQQLDVVRRCPRARPAPHACAPRGSPRRRSGAAGVARRRPRSRDSDGRRHEPRSRFSVRRRPRQPALSVPAWIAVIATVLTMSGTVQPRLRSFTGLAQALQDRADRHRVRRALNRLVGDVAGVEVGEDEHGRPAGHLAVRQLERGHRRRRRRRRTGSAPPPSAPGGARAPARRPARTASTRSPLPDCAGRVGEHGHARLDPERLRRSRRS